MNRLPDGIWRRVAAARLGLVAVAGVLLLAGCASLLPRLQTPQLSLVGVQLQDASVFEQRLLVRLRVQNPNDMVLPVRGITVNFALEGEEFAQGVSSRDFDVPALGEAEFDMLVTANAATALLRVLSQGHGKAGGTLHYRIRGDLKTSLGLLRSVPFDEKGSIPLDVAPRGGSVRD